MKTGQAIISLAKDALSGILTVKAPLIQISQKVVSLQVMASNPLFLQSLDPIKDPSMCSKTPSETSFPSLLSGWTLWNGCKPPLSPSRLPTQGLKLKSFRVFFGLIACHFKGRKGHDMVLKGDYALEDSCSGQDLDQNRPLYMCLRQGMKINMSMVFCQTSIITGKCSRCRTIIDAAENAVVQW